MSGKHPEWGLVSSVTDIKGEKENLSCGRGVPDRFVVPVSTKSLALDRFLFVISISLVLLDVDVSCRFACPV